MTNTQDGPLDRQKATKAYKALVRFVLAFVTARNDLVKVVQRQHGAPVEHPTQGYFTPWFPPTTVGTTSNECYLMRKHWTIVLNTLKRVEDGTTVLSECLRALGVDPANAYHRAVCFAHRQEWHGDLQLARKGQLCWTIVDTVYDSIMVGDEEHDRITEALASASGPRPTA